MRPAPGRARDVGAECIRAGIEIVQHGVAMAESAALGILAAEAHGMIRHRERRERERFRRRPIQRRFAFGHFAPAIEKFFDLRMRFEVFRQTRLRFEQRGEFGRGNAR